MATIRRSGAGGFIGRLAELHQSRAPKQGKGARAEVPLAAIQKFAAPLVELGVNANLVSQHGADLGKAAGGLARLVAAGKGAPAWQSKSFERVLQSSHKLLGALLSALPKDLRAQVAQSTAEAWAELAELPTVKGRAPFAISCATGLVDSALRLQARGNLTLTPDQLAGLGVSTAKEVQALLNDNEARDGRSTMLNLLPRLVEQIELGCEGLKGPKRADLVHDVRMFMQSTLPLSGASLSHAADLAGAVSAQSRKYPGDTTKILAGAAKALAANQAEPLKAAMDLLDHAPPPDPAALGLALHAVLQAQRAGPAELFEVVGQTKTAVGLLNHRAGQDEAKKASVLGLVGLIEQAGVGPTAPAALKFVQVYGRALVDRPAAAVPLLEGLEANEPKALARGLLNTMAAIYPRAVGATPWAEALGQLDKLGPNESLAIAFAHSTVAPKVQCDADLVVALGQRVQEGKEEVGPDLADFAVRWGQAISSIPAGPQRASILSVIVGQGSGNTVSAGQLRSTAQLLQQLTPLLPDTDLTALIGEGLDGELGLWGLCDDGVKWANPPLQTLKTLLKAAGQGAKIDNPNEYARLAMRVAHGAAFIQNGAKRQIPRIVADFATAAKEPEKLSGAVAAQGVVALRAGGGQTKLLTYVKDNEALPADFVLSAGVHLSAAQVAWASKRVEEAHGHDPVRMLRDCVFGCIELNRNDLVEAIRTSPSDPKAITRAIEEIAQAFRVNSMGELPVDALIAGLNAGEDPVAVAADAMGQAAVKGLALDKVEGPLSIAGLNEVGAQTANIAELMVQYTAGFRSTDPDIDMGKLRPVLDEVLKSVVQGTWPAPKYEDDVGLRQLAVLSPGQQAIWRDSTIVAGGAAAPAEAGPVLNEALTLLAGLSKLIPEQVKLPKGVSFDAECAGRLQQELTGILTKLRGAKKGSAAHRALGKTAGKLSSELGLVELQLALTQPNLKQTPIEAFKSILPLIPAGARALRKQGATGCASVLKDAGYMMEDLSPTQAAPGQGRWAADQDSLTAMIASHKSGCLSKGDKRRRWGLAGSLADANTKMLRVFNGDKQVFRTFLRMLPVKIGKYEGPALFIETPVADGGGNEDDRKLLEKVLQDKARQMGVPALGGNAQPPEGWKALPNNTAIEMTFDPGHTGVYHSDRTGQQKHQNAVEPWKYNAQHIQVWLPPELADQF